MSPVAPDRAQRAIGRSAVWSAVGYSLLMASPLLWGVFKGDFSSALGALIAATWTSSPAYGAALCAVASPRRAGAIFFFGVELLVITWFAWVWIDLTLHDPGSTAGFVYLTLPLLQWPALLLVIAVAALLGWRGHMSWPD